MTKVKLGDYVSLQTHKVDNITAVNTSYVSTENLQPNKNGVLFPAASVPSSGKVNFYDVGDILVSNIRPYFKKIWMAINPGTHSSDVLNFRTKSPKLTQEYLYIVLESDSFFDYVTLTSKGTKMPRGDKDAIMDFEFPLPSLDVQQKLSNTIMALERKILMSKQVNDNLQAVISAVWDSLEKPRQITLSDLMTIKSGKRPSVKVSDKDDLHEIPIIGASKIMGYTNAVLLSESIITTGRVGTHGVIQRYREPVWVSDNSFVITSNYEESVYQLLQKVDYDSLNRGTTQPLITQTDLKKYEFPVPTDEDMKTFENHATKLTELVFNNDVQIKTLMKIRDQLLKELIN